MQVVSFPRWSHEAPIQTWAFDAPNGGTMLLRQSIRTHFEAPFLVLLQGKDRSLLIDTGTGDADVRGAVDTVLGDAQLIVAHSHTHSDHVGGDSQFDGRARTTVI